jgi:glycosyltransferase involved in cell wall biosynthesis
MKILLSFQYGFPKTGYGGGQQTLRGFARSLSRLGNDVRVVCGGEDEVGAAKEDHGVEYSFQDPPLVRFRWLATGVATLAAVVSWKPHLVCCFTSEAALVAPVCRALGIPMTIYIGGPNLPPICFRQGLPNLKRGLGYLPQRIGGELSQRVLTVSDYTSRQATEIWGFPMRKVTTVGTGLDEAFVESKNLSSPRARGEPLRLLSVGRIALAGKPLDLVAEALASLEVPWSHWTIIGSGVDEASLVRRLDDLGLSGRVRLVGFQRPTEVARMLAEHDVVLLPSRFESFFMTPYEAVCLGKMVVANDVAEVRHSLGDSRLLVLARDCSSESYCDAIRTAWWRLEEGTSDDVKAGQVRRRYSWQVIAQRFLDAVQELGKERGM